MPGALYGIGVHACFPHLGSADAALACMHAAFRSGAVMGFLLASLGLLVLFITIKIFALVRHTPRVDVISYGCAHA